MIRCLNDVLTIQQNTEDIVNILKSPDLEKEKFILGLKLIYNSDRVDNGFTLLRSIKRLDTCGVIEPTFVEELLNPTFVTTFANTLKILNFILENASHKDLFEMAIHQNMLQYAQKSNMETSSLGDILNLIALITERLNGNNMTDDFMQTICTILVNKISEVPVPREAENIQAQKLDSIQIVKFFESLNGCSRSTNNMITLNILNQIYQLITRDDDVSPLTCLGLAIIAEPYIGNAVLHLLNANRCHNNQKKQIQNAINRLIYWQRTTGFNVPLHVWIEKVMMALYEEKHFDILNEVAAQNIIPCCLTLILPVFQTRTAVVVRTILETQRSEEIFVKSASRFLNVFKHLEKQNSELFEQLIESYADYASNFPHAEVSCKVMVEYLESHHRILNRSAIKQRRLTSASSLSNNVRIGLENLGNSCYINSVIQALFMTKPFCNELLTIQRSDRETMTMQKIFAQLLFSERSELNLKFAMQHIRPQDFMPGLQHDSSEFMGSLLDKLHEADKKFLKTRTEETSEGATGIVDDNGIMMEVAPESPDQDMPEVPMYKIVDNTSELNQSTIVQRTFGGKISTTCVCSSCKSKSISIDSFRDLALSFPEKEKSENWDAEAETEYSVQQLLDYYFTIEQLTLDGDNQYHCEKCKILCDGFRCTELLQPPKNLILTLKHFRYDSRYHTRSKLLINKMFHDETISVKVRTSHDAKSSRNVQYQLHSAVVHSGVSLDSGHYYTFAREKDAVWYKFNDSYVSKSTLQELHNLNSPNTPYILFYHRISTASATASSASCSALIEANEDKLPNFEELPSLLRSFIVEDNAAYRKESKKFIFQNNKPMPKTNRWNDDDPPPSSCGSNFGITQNRFIY